MGQISSEIMLPMSVGRVVVSSTEWVSLPKEISECYIFDTSIELRHIKVGSKVVDRRC